MHYFDKKTIILLQNYHIMIIGNNFLKLEFDLYKYLVNDLILHKLKLF